MPTKSILKNIIINEKHMGRSFMSALEIAQDKPGKEVIISKSCSFLKKEQIKLLFSKDDKK